MPTILRTSLDRLFDDAGLFPPARLPMAEALSVHERVLSGPYAGLVGPFLCPLGRLEELDATVAAGVARPVRLGVLIYPGDQARRAVGRDGVMQVEAPLELEMPEEAARLRRFYELPPTGDVAAAVRTVARRGASAKVRCGGATPDMVPSSSRLAAVLAACAEQQVALKATAGLHQPFRHADPEVGLQHGFVNLLAAASAAVGGAPEEQLVEILEQVPDDADGGGLVDRVERRARELVLSIGTCSLDEPIGALRELGLLD